MLAATELLGLWCTAMEVMFHRSHGHKVLVDIGDISAVEELSCRCLSCHKLKTLLRFRLFLDNLVPESVILPVCCADHRWVLILSMNVILFITVIILFDIIIEKINKTIIYVQSC